METVTGQPLKSEDVDQLWEESIKSKVDALVTRRINLFYDALIERRQISAIPCPPKPEES